MTEPAHNTDIDQQLAELLGELLGIAHHYANLPFPAAASNMAAALKNGETSRDDLANAVAVLAIHLHQRTQAAARRPLPEADRRLTVTSRILGVVSGFGGQRLVADNPAMPRLVDQLADEAEQLARDGLLTPRAEVSS